MTTAIPQLGFDSPVMRLSAFPLTVFDSDDELLARVEANGPLGLSKYPDDVYSVDVAQVVEQPSAISFEHTLYNDTFQKHLPEALGIKRVVGIDHSRAAEANQHAFFDISNLWVAPNYMYFDLTYLEKREDGNGYPRTVRHIVNRRFDDIENFFSVIDMSGVKIIRERRKTLFTGHVRRVRFRSDENVERFAYYKFNPAMDMEMLAKKVFTVMGIETPPVLMSSSPNSYWMIDSGERTLRDVCPEDTAPLEYLSSQFGDVGRRAYRIVAEMALAMCITGNEDFHTANVILSDDLSLKSFDLETTGLPNIEGLWFDGPAKSLAKSIVLYAGEFFGSDGKASASLSYLMKRALPKMKKKMQKVQGTVFDRNEVHSRLILNGGAYYRNIEDLLVFPHYSMKVSTDRFLEMMKARAEVVDELLKK